MADPSRNDRQSRILTQRENALRLIRELRSHPNDKALEAELKQVFELLNTDTSIDLFKQLPTNENEWKKVVSLLEGEELFRVQVRGLEELQQDVTKAQTEAPSTIDSHNLQDILEKSKAANESVRKATLLGQSVKNNTEASLRGILSKYNVIDNTQIEIILKNPKVQAQLNSRAAATHLNAYQSIDGYCAAEAQGIINTNGPIRMLVEAAIGATARELKTKQSKEIESFKNDEKRVREYAAEKIQTELQQNYAKSIAQEKALVEGFKEIEEKEVDGRKTNNAQKLLEESVFKNGVSEGNRPSLKPQLKALLAEANISATDAQIAQVEAHLDPYLLTRITIDSKESRAIVGKALAQSGLLSDSFETQQQITNDTAEFFSANHSALTSKLNGFRHAIEERGITTTSFTQRLSAEGYSSNDILFDALNPDQSSHSFRLPDTSQFHFAEQAMRVYKNPKLINDPRFVQEFFSGTTGTPNELFQRWEHLIGSSETGAPSGIISNIRSWGQTNLSQAQVGLKSFGEGARAFFEPIGKGLSKIDASAVGNGLRSFGSSAVNFAKTVGPQIWQGIVSVGKGAWAVLGEATTATAAAATGAGASAGWIVVVIVAIIAVLIGIQIFFPSATTQARTNLVPLQAGVATSPEDPNYIALICKPGEPDCPAAFCEDCEWPVKCGPVTQCPGGSYSHATSNAIDFGMNGCPAVQMGIYSQVSGVVRTVSMQYQDGSGYAGSSEGYGNYIDITYTDPTTGREFILRYGHVSNQESNNFTPALRVGQNISPGQIIGYADHTGNSSAAHLHYELRAVDGGKAPSITTLVQGTNCN